MTASPPSYEADPRVDEYIDALPDWQQAVRRRLRELIHAADPELMESGGQGNKTARMIAFYRGDTINEPALTAMLEQIVANNRAGGWRKLRARATAR